MKSLIKKIVPGFLLSFYHIVLAVSANIFYGLPSNKLIVVGVTGTSGKSTVIELLAKILEQAGFKVGITSSIKFQINKLERLNDTKMTMVGRFKLQKLIYKMVKAGCNYALIETTSEGIKQYRHLGINYDIAVFTNLFPEHIESHGSFENYKKTKGKLFKRLNNKSTKKFGGKKIKKVIVANIDDRHVDYFLSFEAQEKYGFAINKSQNDLASIIVKADKVKSTVKGLDFLVGRTKFHLPILGSHNVYNALAAITVALSQGINLEVSQKALSQVKAIPGRLEFIDEDQPFKIIVDYAFLPEALEKLYQVVNLLKPKKIINVLGSTGGGRDISRRPKLGKLAGLRADYVIVTNEDPYDDDPEIIIDQVAEGAIKAGKIIDKNLFKILDRRQAIKKALTLAQAGDIVLITGKGCEQAIAGPKGKLIPWDDRKVIREELAKLNN